jgi:hypothetical protein
MLGFLGGSKKKQPEPDSVTGMITDNTAPSGNTAHPQNNGVTGMITDNTDYSGSAKPYTPATNDSVNGMITDNTHPSGHMDTTLRQVQGVTGMITDNTHPSGHVEHAQTDGVTGMITDNTHPSGHVEHPKIEGVTGMITDNSDPSGRPRLDDLHGAADRGNTGGFGGDGTDVSVKGDGAGTGPGITSSGDPNLTGVKGDGAGTGPGITSSGDPNLTGVKGDGAGTGPGITSSGDPNLTGVKGDGAGTGPGITSSGDPNLTGQTSLSSQKIATELTGMGSPEEDAYLKSLPADQANGTGGGGAGPTPDTVDRAVANMQGARNLQSGGGNDAGTQATTPAWHANPNWNAANDTTKAAYSDVSGVNSSQILETRQGENSNTLLRMEDGTYKSVNNSGVATDAGTWNNSQWNDSVMGQAAPITLPVQSTDTAPPAGMNAFHLGHGRDLEI